MEIVAEFEERSIEFYENLVKCGIYDEESVKEFQGRRSRHIQQVCSKNSSVKDYFDFICSERKLSNLVELKEESLDKTSDNDRNKILNIGFQEIKDSLYRCIAKLYLEALRKEPSIRLWRSFISYVRRKRPHEAAKYYDQVLDYYPQNDRCWTEASLWNYEYHRSFEIFQSFIKRGLAIHPNSIMLHKAQFDVGLYEVVADYDRILLGDLDSIDLFEDSLRRVDRIYREIQKNISDLRFYLCLLQRATSEMFEKISAPIQKIIIEDIIVKYTREEELWSHLAKREYMGYNMCDIRDVFAEDDKDPIGTWMNIVRCHFQQFQEITNGPDSNHIKEVPPIWRRRSLEHRYYLCYKVFQVGVSTLLTRKMSTEFINTMLEFNENLNTDTHFKRKFLALAFKICHEKNLLSEKHYCIFLRLLLASEAGKDIAEEILEDVTKNWKSLRFFDLWISYYIEKNLPNMVETVHARAWRVLGVKSAEIFQQAINYFKTRYDEDKRTLLRLFEEAINVNSAEFGKFRVQYLDFCAINMSRETLRLKYDQMAQLPPPCLELHQKMAETEGLAYFQSEHDIARRRRVYENMVIQFGETNPSVWLDYLKFEEVDGDPSRVSPLYQRAKYKMRAREFVEFEKEYVLLKSEMKDNK